MMDLLPMFIKQAILCCLGDGKLLYPKRSGLRPSVVSSLRSVGKVSAKPMWLSTRRKTCLPCQRKPKAGRRRRRLSVGAPIAIEGATKWTATVASENDSNHFVSGIKPGPVIFPLLSFTAEE